MSRNDHIDVEARLKAFVHDPGPEVKPAVMSAFRRRYARPPIWARGVPVYAVATLLALAVGLTLFAEHARSVRLPSSPRPLAAADTTLTWSIAARDQI